MLKIPANTFELSHFCQKRTSLCTEASFCAVGEAGSFLTAGDPKWRPLQVMNTVSKSMLNQSDKIHIIGSKVSKQAFVRFELKPIFREYLRLSIIILLQLIN